MGIFNKIFGKKEQKNIKPNSNLESEPSTENQTIESKEFTFDDLATVDIEEIVSTIQKKRENNIKIFEDTYAVAKELLRQGKAEKAQELTSQDVVAFYPVFAKAEKLEKNGKLEKAAQTYWKNIYENGTDAPANFKRLLIVLSKLGRKEEELFVAKIYSAFVKEKELQKLEKRIINIEKKIKKTNNQ